MAVFGLCDEHLRDAMAEITCYVLISVLVLFMLEICVNLDLANFCLRFCLAINLLATKIETMRVSPTTWHGPYIAKFSMNQLEDYAENLNESAELVCSDMAGKCACDIAGSIELVEHRMPSYRWAG